MRVPEKAVNNSKEKNLETKLMYEPAANGSKSIFLDTCFGGKRKNKILNNWLFHGKVHKIPQERCTRFHRKGAQVVLFKTAGCLSEG